MGVFTPKEITQLIAANMPPPPPPEVVLSRQEEFLKALSEYNFTVQSKPAFPSGVNVSWRYANANAFADAPAAPPAPKCPDCGSDLKQCDHFIVCTSNSCVFIKDGRLEDLAMMEAPF